MEASVSGWYLPNSDADQNLVCKTALEISQELPSAVSSYSSNTTRTHFLKVFQTSGPSKDSDVLQNEIKKKKLTNPFQTPRTLPQKWFEHQAHMEHENQ